VSLRFGTDGVRGAAGTELTPELVLALGRAAARVLGTPGVPFVVGRDTRLSGAMLQAAFSAGVAAEGGDVVDLGVLPTPAVADAALEARAPAAVISASHNPFGDNGVKLLSAGGRKLTDTEEAAVEAELESPSVAARDGSALGRLTGDVGALDRYCAKVVGALEGRRLSGLRVAVDGANGAAWQTAPAILAAAGVDVVEVLGAQPDGTNINDRCGSTDPSGLAASVRRHGADVGLALDGDADRVIAVDDTGEVVDGDRLLALFATDLHERGRLAGPGVAVTVMTNLGFHRAMASAGIEVVSTPVGDRQILEALAARDWSLGGEQSGHIIFRALFPSVAPTGDGTLTGLLLLDLLSRRGAPLSELAASALTRVPQVLVNVRVADHRSLGEAVGIWDEVREVEKELGADGRVLLRSSGTEPLVRVMVEAPSEDGARRAAERLSLAVVEALGRAEGTESARPGRAG
jgi:phosphoglucosamine mutase